LAVGPARPGRPVPRGVERGSGGGPRAEPAGGALRRRAPARSALLRRGGDPRHRGPDRRLRSPIRALGGPARRLAPRPPVPQPAAEPGGLRPRPHAGGSLRRLGAERAAAAGRCREVRSGRLRGLPCPALVALAGTLVALAGCAGSVPNPKAPPRPAAVSGAAGTTRPAVRPRPP